MDDPRLLALARHIEAAGWRWRRGKDIPYGTQLVVSDGDSEATLDFYPKRGRCVIGGADSALRRSLMQLIEAQDQAGAPTPKAAPAGPRIAGPHIGMDESGKGDWYGPLVVAAVFIDPETAMALQRGGVRDSKLIDAEALPRVAAMIEQLVPAQSRQVVALDPAQYNRRYEALGNINLLLAELYAETVAPVLAASGSTRIVCDQFAQRVDRLEHAFASAGLPRPEQMHRAESASVAVAAASVLASARFAAELDRLGAIAGLRGRLPAGASDIRALKAAARHILSREGRAGMARYAKLNFKPVQAIIADG